ncbi:hypothetical protein HD554DRAFT_2165677 [Boletus coccyginus]|nr:hypothetical protein HD554DRAFT_2165677 [Boletus coccyginus]
MSEGWIKKAVCIFYHKPLECLQMLITHLLLAPHMSFVPRKVWTSSAKICHIYENWMSSNNAWNMQDKIPLGSTLLGIVLFIHKNTCVCSLLQDCLFHQALDLILQPLKTAAMVGGMMNNPVGNLRYCYMPLMAWIVNTPEQSLLAGTGPKVSLVTMAKVKNFSDLHRHPLHTSSNTLIAIQIVKARQDPPDYKTFLKETKEFGLNGVLELF